MCGPIGLSGVGGVGIISQDEIRDREEFCCFQILGSVGCYIARESLLAIQSRKSNFIQENDTLNGRPPRRRRRDEKDICCRNVQNPNRFSALKMCSIFGCSWCVAWSGNLVYLKVILYVPYFYCENNSHFLDVLSINWKIFAFRLIFNTGNRYL
jgi:hypothetical protein